MDFLVLEQQSIHYHHKELHLLINFNFLQFHLNVSLQYIC